jgi:hypothetical protein
MQNFTGSVEQVTSHIAAVVIVVFIFLVDGRNGQNKHACTEQEVDPPVIH